jgi:hypothetical protein
MGALALTIGGTLVVGIILLVIEYSYFKRREQSKLMESAQKEFHTEKELQQETTDQISRSTNKTEATPLPISKRKHKDQPYSSLTPQGIAKAIEDAPVLQRTKLAKLYEGQVVTWRGKLADAFETHDGKMTLYIECGDVDVCFGVESTSSLQHLKEGDKIKVTGQIDKAGPGTIELREAIIINVR